MPQIIDWHSHILPAMDDGSRNAEMSLEMLKLSKKGGTDLIFATPHFYADRDNLKSFLKRRDASLTSLTEAISEGDSRGQGTEASERGYPLIRTGAEVAWFSGMGNMEELEKLCLCGTNLILIEMPFSQWSSYTLRELNQIMRRGFTPVIAHLERFYRYQKDSTVLETLLEEPVEIQLNAECFHSFFRKNLYEKLAHGGRMCLLGSDAHNMENRKPELDFARDRIRKKSGEEFLTELDLYGERLLAKHSI